MSLVFFIKRYFYKTLSSVQMLRKSKLHKCAESEKMLKMKIAGDKIHLTTETRND